jgi:molybdopterin synthase catalytic subunit
VTPDASLDWVAVSGEALRPDELSAWVTRPDCGAVVTFCGTARTTSTLAHEIVELEYDTDVGLAESRIRRVSAAARERWPAVRAIAIHHRIGTVPVREPAVVVAVSSPHRREAFEAAQFCIDAVKRTVPMWKREVWEGGSAWSQEAQDIADVRDLDTP